MRDVGLGDKVYSPDLSNFELEGPSGVFGTIASFVTGPIRLVTRVFHNIPILPADLQKEYFNSLLFTSVAVTLIGVVDFVVYRKWPLLLSQLPLIFLSIKQSNKAARVLSQAQVKREVDIDQQQVAELCESVYDKIEDELKKVG